MTKARDELEKIAAKYEPVADSLLDRLKASPYTLWWMAAIFALAVAFGIWMAR